jgi:pimeloyl-ACP methyl ester carboxylesterase
MRAVLVAAILAFAGAAWAGDHLVGVATRPGVKVAYWWMPRPGATATLVLLPGGAGGIGYKGGVPTSTNFLVRSRDRFAAAGFDVAIVGRPSDRPALDLPFRVSDENARDLARVVERVRAAGGKPVWLVGTSNGTVSAAAAAIALGGAIDGLVLTSSVTDPLLPQAVQKLALDRISVPVLVVHHKLDECPGTPPAGAELVVEGLTHASAKKLLLVEGGGPAWGPRCEPMHWHGYIGMEQEVVDAIAAFVRAHPAAASR